MIPITSQSLKEQDDSKAKIIKQNELRLSQVPINDYCTQLMESFIIKNQPEPLESHGYLGLQPDEYFYDQNISIKNNWYIGSGNCFEEFCHLQVKKEEEDEQKLWPSAQIKDEQSLSANHDHGFQACQFPKQEEMDYAPKISFQDPNKFVGPVMISTRQENNIKRKQKVQAYLKKKSIRSFQKKIIYKCRKEVADNRIRYRGRFISVAQAATILNLNVNEQHCPIKLMEELKSRNLVQNQKQPKRSSPLQKEPILIQAQIPSSPDLYMSQNNFKALKVQESI